MIRTRRRRSFQSSTGRRVLALILIAAAVLGGVGLFGIGRSLYYKDKLDDLADFMGSSIRADLNQAMQTYANIDRKSADLTGEVFPALRRYMYSAYVTNRLLVTARGEDYAVLDGNAYSNFTAIMGEYDKLLQNGQNTTQVRASLSDYMADIENILSTRFDVTGKLIPQ